MCVADDRVGEVDSAEREPHLMAGKKANSKKLKPIWLCIASVVKIDPLSIEHKKCKLGAFLATKREKYAKHALILGKRRPNAWQMKKKHSQLNTSM